MNTSLPNLNPDPVPAWQQDRLRRWLAEWSIAQRLQDPDAIPPAPSRTTAVPGARAINGEPGPTPGQIRLLAPVTTANPDRPLYVAVLREESAGAWLIAPFGRFAEPAIPAEWQTGRTARPLRILCLWNTRFLPATILTSSWVVDQFTDQELEGALAVLDHHQIAVPLPDHLALQIGPRLIHPLDPRHDYLETERGLFDQAVPTPAAAGSGGPVVRFPESRERFRPELALAAETPAAYRTARTYQIAQTPYFIIATPRPDFKGLTVRVTDASGHTTTALDGSVLRLPDHTSSTPIHSGQTTLPQAALPAGTVLITPQGTARRLLPKPPSPRR
ncbi:hypothetical protein HQ590_15700 [bacterium]|nr:hypothetical protein [bacterium]